MRAFGCNRFKKNVGKSQALVSSIQWGTILMTQSFHLWQQSRRYCSLKNLDNPERSRCIYCHTTHAQLCWNIFLQAPKTTSYFLQCMPVLYPSQTVCLDVINVKIKEILLRSISLIAFRTSPPPQCLDRNVSCGEKKYVCFMYIHAASKWFKSIDCASLPLKVPSCPEVTCSITITRVLASISADMHRSLSAK